MTSTTKSHKKKSSSGGRASSIGTEYQTRVAAWFCVQILLEQNSVPICDQPAGVYFTSIETQTEEEIDDLNVYCSNGDKLLLNIKHKVSNSTNPTSDFGKAIHQIIKQFFKELKNNSSKSKFAIVTASDSSKVIRNDLKSLLERIRHTREENLSKIPKNQKEKAVLENINLHVEQFWIEETGNSPTEKQVKGLLEKTWIEVLDVDHSGRDERHSQSFLKSNILEKKKEANKAWDSLVKLSLTLHSSSGGMNLQILQSHLINQGFILKDTQSFIPDIEKLKNYSSKTLRSLKELSVIRIGEKELKIKRPVIKELKSKVESKSVVVVGEPGSGKSGVLYDFVEELSGNTTDFVFLAVDRIEANNSIVFHQELRVENNFQNILQNWVGIEPAYLVVDALDASRDPEKAKFIHNLIQETLENESRWRVVVSIREFDLRYNSKLHKLFKGEPISGHESQEFREISHIKISRLTIDELLQIPQQSEEFRKLILQADESLLELLLSPFNLKLIGELIGEGIELKEISPIQTQIELLERYWLERVIGTDSFADNREGILIKAVNEMVSTRQMQVNRQELSSSDGRTLQEILSRNIMSEWKVGEIKSERNVLNFSHHILFDYAISRLFLRGTENTLIEKLENDRELVMAIRPSIVFHFQYWASTDENFFWRQIFRTLKSSKIPSIGKLIGPSVAAETANTTDFFNPLFEILDTSDSSEREIGETTLHYVITSLRVTENFSPGFLLKDGKKHWTDLLEILSENLTLRRALNIRVFLWTILNKNTSLTEEQRDSIGLVARRILKFALTLSRYDYMLTTSMITHICRTFESDPIESEEILRQLIEPDHVLSHGYKELIIFSDEITELASNAPDFVEQLYQVTFTYFDSSGEKTSISDSRIMGMTSTRQQDYGMARFSLNAEFNKFLAQEPIYAIRALIDIVEAYFKQNSPDRSSFLAAWGNGDENSESQKDAQVETFIFDGKEVNFRSDKYSRWSGSVSTQEEYPLKMLETFKYFIEELCKDSKNEPLLEKILDLIVERNQSAVFWKIILECGTLYPDTLGKKVKSLAWTMPILLNNETTWAIGDFLKSNFKNFDTNERKETENKILSIVDVSKEDNIPNHQLEDRNRLLGCLPEEYLTSDEVKELFAKIRKEEKVPKNKAPNNFGVTGDVPYDEDEYLRQAGVDLADKSNQLINDFSKEIKVFANKFLNDTPELSDIKPIIPILRKLYIKLIDADDNESTQILLDNAWRELVSGCEAVARIQNIKEEKIVSFLRQVLLSASDHYLPEPNQRSEEQHDDHPSWGSVRGEAVRGLLWLTISDKGADSEVLEKIEQLALNDTVSAVRFQAIRGISSLYATAPDMMWRIIESVSSNEKSRGNLEWLVRDVLQVLATHHPEQIFELTKTIYEKFKDIEKSVKLREECTQVFIKLAFNLKHSESWNLMENFISDSDTFGSEIRRIIMSAGECLNLGVSSDTKEKEENEYIRHKSFELLEKVSNSLQTDFTVFTKEMSEQGDVEWGEESIARYKQLHNLLDLIATKVFFASGAYTNKYDNSEKKIPMDEESRKQFLIESEKLLYSISGVGFADVIHRLVETVRFLLPQNPEQVFLILINAIKSGKEDGYQFESLAASEIVAIVERVLAEYKYILKENEKCRDGMIEILDTFVEAGWTEAQRITYRLEDIFR